MSQLFCHCIAILNHQSPHNFFFSRYRMNLKRCLLISKFLCMLLVSNNAWWPFYRSSTEETEAEQGRYLKNSPVPFEMTTAEEKFLAEAKKYMGNLTPLDTCHQIIIDRIKKSCGDINEVELAKLGVALLNCQSKCEGRKTYECTDDMELRDCTADMDANTWDSYHIISKRARSICYATRQQQFRLKTEFTVNQLASQAENQMELMNCLQEGQRTLTEVADDIVIRVTAGRERLVEQQEQLHSNYDDVQRSIAFSLRGNVRALIDSGWKQLKDMAKALKEKLDHTTLQMKSYHSETTQPYNETMENLKTINDAIGYLIKVTNHMQDKIDNRLVWLTRHLGGTGDKLALVATCLMHAGYFLIATLCILFVNAPLFTWLVVLVIVPINAWMDINFDSSLAYSALSCIIAEALLGNWLYIYLTKKCFPSNADRVSKSSPLALNLARSLCRQETPNDTENVLDTIDSIENLDDSAVTLKPKGPVGNTKRQLKLTFPVAASTPNSKITFPRRRCGAPTKTGLVCKRVLSNGSFKCTVHLRMCSSYIPDEC